MANYLYNGENLPDIDTVWIDKKNKPYATIRKQNNIYYLTYRASKYSEAAIVTNSTIYKAVDGEWVSTGSSTLVGSGDVPIDMIWTSHDIYNEDGTLYLAASDPVPVSPVKLNPALLVQSFFTGQAIRRMRGKPVAHTHAYTPAVTAPTCTEKGFTTYTCACGDSYTAEETEALGHAYVSEVIAPTTETEGYTIHTCSRCGDSYKDSYTEKLPEPVAYLFGRVRWPAPAPEYDKQQFPYSFMWFYPGYQRYTLYVVSEKATYGNSYIATPDNTVWNSFEYIKGSNKWNGPWNTVTGGIIKPSSEIKWANFDIINEADGTIWKTGSDPVPVYE